jgi:1,4-dihydroxy-2-naphthoyl-CoA synthase
LRQIEATEPMEALGIMTQLIAELRIGEEGQEGLGAFLEKREPFWRGT